MVQFIWVGQVGVVRIFFELGRVCVIRIGLLVWIWKSSLVWISNYLLRFSVCGVSIAGSKVTVVVFLEVMKCQ